MVKRYKRIIYTFKNSIEVYEYLDGKYGAPERKRGKKRKLTKKRSVTESMELERKVRHKDRSRRMITWSYWTYKKK